MSYWITLWHAATAVSRPARSRGRFQVICPLLKWPPSTKLGRKSLRPLLDCDCIFYLVLYNLATHHFHHISLYTAYMTVTWVTTRSQIFATDLTHAGVVRLKCHEFLDFVRRCDRFPRHQTLVAVELLRLRTTTKHDYVVWDSGKPTRRKNISFNKLSGKQQHLSELYYTMRLANLSSIALRKSSVTRNMPASAPFFEPWMQIERSFVIFPSSMVSMHAFSRVWANL